MQYLPQDIYFGQTSRSLKARYQERTRYIKTMTSDPHTHCIYSTTGMNDTMSLLKLVNKPHLLLPFEQMCIDTLDRKQWINSGTTTER